ncbi:MAG: uroporphyrinogen-III synthase [Bacteroidota bacterium]
MSQKSEYIATRQLSTQSLEQIQAAGLRLRTVPLIDSRQVRLGRPLDGLAERWIFTSAKAVKSLLAQDRQAFLAAAAARTLAVVGEKSTRLLKEQGLTVAVTAPQAEALTELLIAAYEPGGATYFCGNRSMETLPNLLQFAGFKLETYPVYETLLMPQEVSWKTAKGALFFSPSAVDSYFQENSWPVEKTAFAIGTTTAKALATAGVKQIETAGYPSEAALIQKLLTWENAHVPATD